MSTLTLRGKLVEAVGNWVPLWPHVQNEADRELLKRIKAMALFEDNIPVKVAITEDCDDAIHRDFAELEEEEKLIEHTILHLSGKYAYLNNWDSSFGEDGREVVNELTVSCPACLHLETNVLLSGWTLVQMLWNEMPECFCEDCQEMIPNPELLQRNDVELYTFVLEGSDYYVQVRDAQTYLFHALWDLDVDEHPTWASPRCIWTQPKIVPHWVERAVTEGWQGIEPVTSH